MEHHHAQAPPHGLHPADRRLILSGCGDGGSDTASSSPSSGGHGSGHSSSKKNTAATASDADIAFLAGMKPHHQQADEMSDIVLAANPPADVAKIAQQIKAAHAPEIEQINKMLTDLGQSTNSADHCGADSAHGGMMSEKDLVRTAPVQAQKSFLSRHHARCAWPAPFVGRSCPMPQQTPA